MNEGTFRDYYIVVSSIVILQILYCYAIAFGNEVSEVKHLSPKQVTSTLFNTIQVECFSSSQVQMDETAQAGKIEEIVENVVALDKIASRIYGSKWKRLTRLQKNEFIFRLKNVMILSIINQLYSCKSRYTFVDDIIKNNNARVRFTIARQNKISSIVISYQKLHFQWKVTDINIDGMSLVRNYMHQIRPIVDQNGFEGTMARLNEVTKRLRENTISN